MYVSTKATGKQKQKKLLSSPEGEVGGIKTKTTILKINYFLELQVEGSQNRNENY